LRLSSASFNPKRVNFVPSFCQKIVLEISSLPVEIVRIARLPSPVLSGRRNNLDYYAARPFSVEEPADNTRLINRCLMRYEGR
jgi:hypothetical protein